MGTHYPNTEIDSRRWLWEIGGGSDGAEGQ